MVRQEHRLQPLQRLVHGHAVLLVLLRQPTDNLEEAAGHVDRPVASRRVGQRARSSSLAEAAAAAAAAATAAAAAAAAAEIRRGLRRGPPLWVEWRLEHQLAVLAQTDGRPRDEGDEAGDPEGVAVRQRRMLHSVGEQRVEQARRAPHRPSGHVACAELQGGLLREADVCEARGHARAVREVREVVEQDVRGLEVAVGDGA